jgi:monofunctional biosynthetic peptidoglycan transglycosylase
LESQVKRFDRRPRSRPNRRIRKRPLSQLKRFGRWALAGIIGYYGVCCFSFFYLKWFPPLTTSVQIQRRLESLFAAEKYRKRYDFVRLGEISEHLVHAAIASEDARFYDHSGIDWVELHTVVTSAWKHGELERGGSTITQQLVKNLFLTAYRSVLRKIPELTLAPMAELFLSKRRIVELYLNVIEWGPGVYGAEAAARFYYDTSARHLDREQAARLVACLPSPLTREPEEMDRRSARILARMADMGW